jgi:alpha-glucoside transport system substrate-binding protein
MQRLRYVVPFAALVLIAAACTNDEGGGGETGGTTGAAQEENTGTVNVLSALAAEEADTLQTLWDSTYGSQVDYQVEFEGSEQFEEQLQIRSEAGTLDTILLPQPGAVKAQAASGNALSLEDLGYNVDDLNATFGDYFVSLGEFEGQHYGLPTNSNWKSLIWYPKVDFDKAGYEIPTTWDELMALSDQIVADGGTPWCVGFESGTATGWPATDWVEDIMLRTQKPDVYDKWTTNEVKFTDPAVVAAIDEFGKFAKNEKYVDGGVAAVASTDFRDSPKGLFAVPPKCYLHHQASFIPSFFPEGTKLGTDADFFYMPTYAAHADLGKPVLGAGTLVSIAKDSPTARAFIDFLKTPVAHELWMAQSSFLTPYKGVNVDAYANEQMKKEGEILTSATTFRFDGSDLMPGKIGAGAFWTGMVDFVGGKSAQDAAAEIQSAWDGIK